MKKAKVMLTAIAILGLVGGALAFKARSTFQIFQRSGSTCPLVASSVYDVQPNGVPFQNIYTTVNPTTLQVPTSLCTTTLSLVIE